jgi:hypothetical protein
MLFKILQISSYVLLIASAIIFLGFYWEWFSTGAFITWGYILFAIAAGVTIIFGLVNWIMKLVSAPKKAMGSVIGIVGLLVVFGLAYAISSEGSVAANVMDKSEITLSTSHTIGMAVKAMYILGGLAVLAVVYAEVSKIFK